MTTDAKMPHVDLNALIKPCATVDLDKETYEILPIQGDARILFDQIVTDKQQRDKTGERPDDKTYLELATRIVISVAPKIPEARVRAMAIQQLTTIIALSMGVETEVRTVMEKAAGKGRGPARKKGTRSGRR